MTPGAGGLLQIAEPGQQRPISACARRAIGIDLGTTYSLVAAVRNGVPACLLDAGGRVMTPSIVHYAASAAVLVGWEAREMAVEAPWDTLASIKRFMGRGINDQQVTRERTTYHFAESKDGLVRFDVGGRTVTPIEVSAEILRVLRHRAEVELGGPLDGAVITVPAYFDDAQRQATKDAGRLAGLDVLRLLNEPTAAALAYGLDKRREGTFAIYDLGGGTFDISILHLEVGVFQVMATCGDTALGGDDIDRAFAEWLAGESIGDARAWRVALADARSVKERLSEAEEYEFRGRRVGRGDLDRVARSVIERTAAPCRRALKDAGLEPGKLDGVVLVGGQTRMPLVRGFVRDLFGIEPLTDIDPDQVVALGAAIQADVLAGSGRDDILLLDVIPLSLGIETMGGIVERLLQRNSTIPATAEQMFTTYADHQSGMDIHVVQGERELVDQCRSLARFTLKGIPRMPAGLGRVKISFQVDADGILTASARELTTGVEQKVEVKPTYGLSDEEVERMLLDSYEHAENDVKERLLREERVETERMLQDARKALLADGDLLEGSERQAIEEAMAALRTTAMGADYHRIRELREGLDHVSIDFAQRRMDRAVQRALTGRKIEEAAK